MALGSPGGGMSSDYELSEIMQRVLARPASESEARVAFGKLKRKFRRLGDEVVSGVIQARADPKVVVGCEYNLRDGMVPGSQTRAPPPPKEQGGSLSLIFEFYSKLQSPGFQMGRGLTYEEIKNCNERVSFFELICFCRDFKIVPRLASKSTLQYLWKVATAKCNRSAGNAGDGDQSLRDAGLDLEEFLMILVRIALVAYATKAIGQPQLAVQHLIRFLDLEHVEKIRHHIRTQGRETQRHVNFRSAGELEMGYGRKALEEKREEIAKRARKASRAAIVFSSSQLSLLAKAPKMDDFTTVNKVNFLSVASQVLLASFDKDMANFLEPYCSLRAAQHWVPLDALGVDGGTLERGQRYGVRICVLNRSAETLVVTDLRKTGDAGAAVRAIFDPNPFVPGLTRHVELLIEPKPTQGGEFVGTVDVEVSSNARKTKAFVVSVPLFFRVESVHVAVHEAEAEPELANLGPKRLAQVGSHHRLRHGAGDDGDEWLHSSDY